ncbi:unnamed protein product, partial [Laminaria digitata]
QQEQQEQKKKGSSKKTGVPLGEGKGGGGGRVEKNSVRGSITVVSAFEGYAFDAGVRPGGRITATNGQPVSRASVDKV